KLFSRKTQRLWHDSHRNQTIQKWLGSTRPRRSARILRPRTSDHLRTRPVEKFAGSRLAGLSALHTRLGLQDGGRSGGLKIFRGCCPNLVRTLPALVYSTRNPEEIDSECEDHAVDALRYGLLWKQPEGGRVRLGGI